MSYESKGSTAPNAIVSKGPDRSGNYPVPAGGTSDEDYINQALSDLTVGRTWHERVALRGAFHIDGTILLPSWSILDLYQASIYLEDGSDCNVISQSADENNNMRILGGHIDCNRENQASGMGINITNVAYPTPAENSIRIEDLIIENAREDLIHLSAVYRADILRVHALTSYDRALYMNTGDCLIAFSNFQSYDEQIHLESCADIEIDNCYLGGTAAGSALDCQLYIRNGHRINFTDCRVLDFREHGVRLVNSGASPCWGVNFNGGYIGHEDDIDADDTYSGIRFEGDTHHCGVTGMYIGQKTPGTTTRNLLYGVEERDTADYNEVNTKNFVNVDYPVVIVGAHSSTGDPLVLPFARAVGGATESDTEPAGILVDANGESALIRNGSLPQDLLQVWKLRVVGVADAAPFAAGGQMHADFTLNAGAMNLAYNTAAKSWTITSLDSEETDYIQFDGVSWVIEDGDVANELQALAGGDVLSFHAIHRAADDPDGETDCFFRTLEVYFV